MFQEKNLGGHQSFQKKSVTYSPSISSEFSEKVRDLFSQQFESFWMKFSGIKFLGMSHGNEPRNELRE